MLGSAPNPGRVARACERLTARLSLLIGGVLVVCVSLAALGVFMSAKDRVDSRAKHSTHALDWLLWFGGAKDDQTFEKYLKDTAEKNQREWEEKLRDSPVYQFDADKIDWKRAQWKIEPVPLYKTPARRSR
jgi:hypothetical protein